VGRRRGCRALGGVVMMVVRSKEHGNKLLFV
jgi:hypothetical protein